MRFPIIKNDKIWLSVSAAIVLVSLTLLFTLGLNLGLDFTGGTSMALRFQEQEPQAVEVKTVLLEVQDQLNQEKTAEEKIKLGEPLIAPGEEKGSFNIKLKDVDEATHSALLQGLEQKFGSLEETKFTSVGPVAGKSLKNRAVMAIVVALVVMIAYLAYEFRNVPGKASSWKFGVIAIIALAHDLLLVTGIFVLLGRFWGVEADMFFVTALLTILGYSVNDTIVIFDRIREKMVYQSKGESLAEIAESALWSTMVRSINTSLTVFLVLLSLFFLGSESVRWFAFALLCGTVTGTYSSIFIASPLLVRWNKK